VHHPVGIGEKVEEFLLETVLRRESITADDGVAELEELILGR
jgi:hypothetical protein